MMNVASGFNVMENTVIPVKRSPLPKRRTPLKRSSKPIAKRKRPNRKRLKPRRVMVDRNASYLFWLRENCVCIACVKLFQMGANPGGEWCQRIVDPAHTSNNGGGSKGPDSGAVPLCRFHHRQQHSIGMREFEARYGLDLKADAAAHFELFKKWQENSCL